MKVQFITSGKINYILGHLSLYNSIRATSLGLKYPKLDKSGKEEIIKFCQKLSQTPSAIVTAPSAQAFQTAQIIADYYKVPLIKTKALLPLKFDISSLMSEAEFIQSVDKAFDILRNRFLEAYFRNHLKEANGNVGQKLKHLSKISQKYQGHFILAVSHAFLIKLFEIYSQVGDQMYQDKKVLFKLFNPSIPPFGRLEGVTIYL